MVPLNKRGRGLFGNEANRMSARMMRSVAHAAAELQRSPLNVSLAFGVHVVSLNRHAIVNLLCGHLQSRPESGCAHQYRPTCRMAVRPGAGFGQRTGGHRSPQDIALAVSSLQQVVRSRMSLFTGDSARHARVTGGR